jgi:N-acetylmuramoyl-L-alanine amidase
MIKAAIIVGHSSEDGGAYNGNIKINEFDYNKRVANLIQAHSKKIDIEIVYRDTTYSALPKKVNMLIPYAVISLHCNAFNTKASGFEVLSSGSKGSLKLANIISDNCYNEIFDKIPNRGIKIKKLHDGGGLILHKTKAPCVLLEPFFIDNDTDLELGLKEIENYAIRIVGALEMYFNIK